MNIADRSRPAIGALALGVALCLTPALALAKSSLSGATPLKAASSADGLETMAATVDYTLDVTGILSNDGEGASINETREIQIGANRQVVGIGWDVELYADAPSWLSEMVVSFGPSSSALLYLTPGVGDSFSGAEFYSSGGVVDLVGLGLDFAVGNDGKLRMEFFEDFDDFPDDWDGVWQSGSLTIQVAVPEPATYGMMALGLLAVGAAARRRRG